MATSNNSTMVNLEQRRVQLEENVAKLRQALKHWKTWELEYEMLKEEIDNAVDPSPLQMLEIGRNLGADLVNEKEVEEILCRERRTMRSAAQVKDLISRRVDYVRQNITTVDMQLQAAETKLNAATVLLEPDVDEEEGFPLMDIQEELDEEGNVISSSVSQPSKAAPEIVGALQKAGIGNIGLEESGTTKGNAEGSSGSRATPAASKDRNLTSTHEQSNSTTPSEAAQRSLPGKAVSFSDPEPAPEDESAEFAKTGVNPDLKGMRWNRGHKVIEVDDYEREVASFPIDESPEDAALRREMLNYGLSEVGQVVAEINLEGRDEDYSDDLDEGDVYDDDEDEDEDEIEDEDQYGRTTRPVLTEDYKQQMLELEKKLNARMLENVGPHSDATFEEHADDIRRVVVRNDGEKAKSASDSVIKDSEKPASAKLDTKKKGVRFAESLDVSPALQPAKDASSTSTKPISQSTMSDSIIERTGATSQPPSVAPSKPAKVSRFKSARSTPHQPVMPMPMPEAPPMPQGPPGRTLSNTVIERAPDPSSVAAEPDEFDPALLNREVQVEYHKMRNRAIQQQGGFLPDEEEKEEPLMEEVDGKTKKVSRFRAAKLRADGAL